MLTPAQQRIANELKNNYIVFMRDRFINDIFNIKAREDALRNRRQLEAELGKEAAQPIIDKIWNEANAHVQQMVMPSDGGLVIVYNNPSASPSAGRVAPQPLAAKPSPDNSMSPEQRKDMERLKVIKDERLILFWLLDLKTLERYKKECENFTRWSREGIRNREFELLLAQTQEEITRQIGEKQRVATPQSERVGPAQEPGQLQLVPGAAPLPIRASQLGQYPDLQVQPAPIVPLHAMRGVPADRNPPMIIVLKLNENPNETGVLRIYIKELPVEVRHLDLSKIKDELEKLQGVTVEHNDKRIKISAGSHANAKKAVEELQKQLKNMMPGMELTVKVLTPVRKAKSPRG